jgi:hypothetical protein
MVILVTRQRSTAFIKKKNINKYIEYNKREREREFVIRKTQCCGINMDITPLLL